MSCTKLISNKTIKPSLLEHRTTFIDLYLVLIKISLPKKNLCYTTKGYRNFYILALINSCIKKRIRSKSYYNKLNTLHFGKKTKINLGF